MDLKLVPLEAEITGIPPERIQDVRVAILRMIEDSDPRLPHLGAALVGVRWEWPAFTDWDRRFRAIDFRHMLWPEGELTFDVPADINAVGFESRLVWLALEYVQTKRELERHTTLSSTQLETALAELSAARLVHSATPAEQLSRVDWVSVRAWAKGLGLRPSRTKQETISAVAAWRPEVIADYVRGRGLEPMVARSDPPHGDRVICPSDDLVYLLAHTLLGYAARARQWPNRRFAAAAEIMTDAPDACPCCLNRATRIPVAELTIDRLPPFHPGCRCVVAWQTKTSGSHA